MSHLSKHHYPSSQNRGINDKICPFCHGANHCMVEAAHSCWCQSTPVPKALQQLVPIEHQRRSCICASCVALFNQDPAAFSVRYATKR